MHGWLEELKTIVQLIEQRLALFQLVRDRFSVVTSLLADIVNVLQ